MHTDIDFTRLYIGDYVADTMDMTADQHGVFRKLLLHLWLEETTSLRECALRKTAALSRAD